jgi:hypothetical protein
MSVELVVHGLVKREIRHQLLEPGVALQHDSRDARGARHHS